MATKIVLGAIEEVSRLFSYPNKFIPKPPAELLSLKAPVHLEALDGHEPAMIHDV